MNVSKMAAKALDEEPEDMAIRIAGATIDMLTETSPLQKGTVPHFYWVIKAVDSSLRNCVMTRSRFEDARTFRQLYMPMKQFIDENLKSPSTSRWSMSK